MSGTLFDPDSNSFSDNVIPFRRANAKRGKCHLYGMPRPGQFRTAEMDKPNSSANTSTPNRAIKSDALMPVMISRCEIFGNPDMRCVRTKANPKQSVTFSASGVTLRDVGQNKKKYTAFGRRLKLAREALFDGNGEQFALLLDLNPQTYRNYERGDRSPDENVVRQLALRGISLQWLFLEEKPMLDPSRAQAKDDLRRTG